VRRRWWGVLVALVLVLIGAGLRLWYGHAETNYPPLFGNVVRGKIYRSGQPTPGQIAELVATKGTRTLLNLRQQDELRSDSLCGQEIEFARNHNLQFISLPFTTPPTDEMIRELLRVLDDERNYPILMHCHGGESRTGVAVAIYRLERTGWEAKKAVKEMLRFAGGAQFKSGTHEYDKVLWIQSYKPSHPRAEKTN